MRSSFHQLAPKSSVYLQARVTQRALKPPDDRLCKLSAQQSQIQLQPSCLCLRWNAVTTSPSLQKPTVSEFINSLGEQVRGLPDNRFAHPFTCLSLLDMGGSVPKWIINYYAKMNLTLTVRITTMSEWRGLAELGVRVWNPLWLCVLESRGLFCHQRSSNHLTLRDTSSSSFLLAHDTF